MVDILLVTKIDEEDNTLTEVLATASGSNLIFSNPVTFNNGLLVEPSGISNVATKQYVDAISDLAVHSGAMSHSFASSNVPYIYTSSTSYQALADLYFPGSDVKGTITSIQGVAATANIGANGTIRIQDITNNNTVATATINSKTLTIITFSGIDNVPANEAIFEIQIKRNSGTGAIRLYSVLLK